MNLSNDFYFIIPELIILLTAITTLLSGLFFKKNNNTIFLIAVTGVFLALASTIKLFGVDKVFIFNGLLVIDRLAMIMKIAITALVFLVFVYSRQYIDERKIPKNDYYVLGLLSTLGMLSLVSANSLLVVYLGIELLSLPLYTMTAIRRTDNIAAEAAMKYFVMGSTASALLLFGMSLLYGATGHLELTAIHTFLTSTWPNNSSMIIFALVFLIAGIAFKLAAAPFHMWAPDVYDGAPTSVTLFISAAPKIAALSVIFRLINVSMAPAFEQWQQLILLLAILSIVIGNLFAISQINIKRMFAYSAISHIGFGLLGIAAGSAAGSAAALYYVLIYALTACAGFGLLTILSVNGIEIEQITDLKGLNKQNPWLALMMMIVIFSMAGIPPTVGFFTKLLVLKSLIDVNLITYAILALVFTIVGLYYYLNIIKIMYFDNESTQQFSKPGIITTIFYSSNCLSLLLLGIFPAGLISLCMTIF